MLLDMYPVIMRTTGIKLSKNSLRNGTTTIGFTLVELLVVIVVIAILAALSVAAYNGIQSRAHIVSRDATLSQWRTTAALYRTDKNIDSCPGGYSFVYGNAEFDTSDFCVMKYEAKIQGNDDGAASYTTSTVPESRASGTPWVNIAQTDASTVAANANGHLITEAEWMTIAADVLSVSYNWSGGSSGLGIVYQGHVNGNPSLALSASDDDHDDLNGYTGGTGANSGSNSSRVLYLSSGDSIWDFSGNVWEWTAQAQNMSQVGVVGENSWSWKEWNLGTLSLGNLPAASRPSMIQNLPVGSWGSAQGVGQISSNYIDTGTRSFLRSGDWADSPGVAGVLVLNLTSTPTATSTHVGFRVTR